MAVSVFAAASLDGKNFFVAAYLPVPVAGRPNDFSLFFHSRRPLRGLSLCGASRRVLCHVTSRICACTYEIRDLTCELNNIATITGGCSTVKGQTPYDFIIFISLFELSVRLISPLSSPRTRTLLLFFRYSRNTLVHTLA